MPKTYKWKPFANYSVDAQTAGEHLKRLKGRRKYLPPEDVLEDARDETSPIHYEFDWDDSVAAEKHRLSQARDMIRSLVYVSVEQNEDREEETMRAYVNIVSEDRKHHYMDTEDAFRSPELAAQIVRQAWNELRAFRRRYEQYLQFNQVWRAMDQIEEEEQIQSTARKPRAPRRTSKKKKGPKSKRA